MIRAFALLGLLFALVLAGATGVGLGLWLARDAWRDGSDEIDESDFATGIG